MGSDARAFQQADGQIDLSSGPLSAHDVIQAGGQTFVMVSDPNGPIKYKGGVVSVVSVDPQSGEVQGPADPEKADDKKVLGQFIGKMGAQWLEPQREINPEKQAAAGQAPETGAPSLMALTPTESFERKLNEAYGPKMYPPKKKCPKCGKALSAFNSVSGAGTCVKCGSVNLPVESFERKLNEVFPMKTAEVRAHYYNDRSPDQFEHLFEFSDGAVAATSEKVTVLRTPDGKTEELGYKSTPSGPYGEALEDAIERGKPAPVPMGDEQVRMWQTIVGPQHMLQGAEDASQKPRIESWERKLNEAFGI
jgi:hypothetical protein